MPNDVRTTLTQKAIEGVADTLDHADATLTALDALYADMQRRVDEAVSILEGTVNSAEFRVHAALAALRGSDEG